MKVDLILWKQAEDVDHPAANWQLGQTYVLAPEVRSAANALDGIIAQTVADFVLFWDEGLSLPDGESVLRLCNEKADVIHAGLKMGMAGLPSGADYVGGACMLNVDPATDTRASSWRLSLKATLARVEALKVLGHIDRAFKTLDGAGLEMGYRMLERGAILIHSPELVKEAPKVKPGASITERDMYLFFIRNRRWFWAPYVFVRRVLNQLRPIRETIAVLSAYMSARRTKPPIAAGIVLTRDTSEEVEAEPKVSVMIPTLNRYDHLRRCLECLSKQTIKPYEIICADQTPEKKRSEAPYKEFPDLPIITIFFESRGQWTARNAALRRATGDYLLFFDDDITFNDDLIEQHLRGLSRYGADVSVGLVDARRGHPLPDHFLYFRQSENFPSGNSLAKSSAVRRAGSFDLNFDGSDCGDLDFAMRLYLTGAVMLHNPEAGVIHHLAHSGGMREFGVHTIVNEAPISRLLNTDVPSRTSIYRFLKHFSETQVREGLTLSFLLQFKVRGFFGRSSFWLKLIRVPAVVSQIPSIILRMRRNLAAARELLQSAEAQRTLVRIRSENRTERR